MSKKSKQSVAKKITVRQEHTYKSIPVTIIKDTTPDVAKDVIGYLSSLEDRDYKTLIKASNAHRKYMTMLNKMVRKEK